MGEKYKNYKGNLDYLLENAAIYKLRGTEYRVLIYLITRLSFDKYRPIDRHELCDDLEIKKTNLAAALQNIIDAGFLEVSKTNIYGKNLLFKLPERGYY